MGGVPDPGQIKVQAAALDSQGFSTTCREANASYFHQRLWFMRLYEEQ